MCLLASGGASAATYLDELVARSRELRLAERREWHRLMHYVPNLVAPGVHSLADASRFFAAHDGKTNPQTELEATLAAFFSDTQETPEVQNPQCAFIARYQWLSRELAFDEARLRKQPCTRFREWHKALNPQGVTLVFPAAYLNNPASMYGHTLLRIDARDQDETTRLLAYSINYTVNSDGRGGFAFTVKALIGSYPGTFSSMPYYLKVREYSDLENRDIWEYELNLSAEEIDRLLMHAWELGPTHFDYFFFDENCAYHLLGLLEAARPDLDLTQGFRWWAIPSDTVREVVKQKGLVKSTLFRPSNATVIRHRLELMSAQERALAASFARGLVPEAAPAFATLSPPSQARVLEVGYDYLSYLRTSGKSPVEDPAALSRSILSARSRIAATTNDPPVPAPQVRPDQGHGTARIAMGGGRRDGANFVELRARATYHDLMDPDAGYVPGAQIQYLDVAVRDYSGAIGARVEEITPVSLVSISPRSEFFEALSWKLEVSWARRRLADRTEPLVFGVHGGPGLAWTRGQTMVYAFLESTLQLDTHLEKNYALGAGPGIGALIDLTSRWRAEPYARGQWFFAGDTDTPWAAGLRQRYTLAREWALRLDLSRERQEKQAWNTVLLSLHHYF